ncbi:uncharacterized protein cd44a isoform X1 [Epinephelus lanceolatus]|uniref:uncharacterized protein DDB_G0271670-like n=1 Tax=Epinephelus lanceolatus TaxID=310571 RepID=UPI001446BE52|nr:uncharacterized protein DDB_G0271670-like [Epinephelus lanceolatus]
MGASQVSGMKMRNLLFGLIFGLLAVVHSTPVDTVTQIPAKAEDDILREAVTDGFLVEHPFTPSRTTESPKRNTTVQASQQPSTDSKQDDMIEGSGTDFESMTSIFHKFASTTPHVSHAQSSTSTVLPGNTDSSSSHSSTTQSLQSTTTSSPNEGPNEAQPNVTPDHISHSQTTDPAVSSFGFPSTHSSESGSGVGGMLGHHSSTTTSMTSSSSTETSAASSSSTAASVTPKTPVMFAGNEGSGSGEGLGSGMYSTDKEPVSPATEERNISTVPEAPAIIRVIQPQQQPSPTEPRNKGHTTPGWIIILGFIVGLAALIMLCVAIATRDKWNGPSKASQLVSKTNSSNQQRGLEMETFLHKDQPRENGKASEYTVIPLDELPEKCSSH